MRSENFKQANRSRFSSENLNVPGGWPIPKEVMLSEKYVHEHTFVNFHLLLDWQNETVCRKKAALRDDWLPSMRSNENSATYDNDRRGNFKKSMQEIWFHTERKVNHRFSSVIDGT